MIPLLEDSMKEDLVKVFPNIKRIKSISQTENCSNKTFNQTTERKLDDLDWSSVSRVKLYLDWLHIPLSMIKIKPLILNLFQFSSKIQKVVQSHLMQIRREHEQKLGLK